MRRLPPFKPLQTEGLRPRNDLTGHSSLVRKQGSVFWRADGRTDARCSRQGFIGSRRGSCTRAEQLEEFSAARWRAGQAAFMTSLKIHPRPRLRLKGFPGKVPRAGGKSCKNENCAGRAFKLVTARVRFPPPLVSVIWWGSIRSHTYPSLQQDIQFPLEKICCKCKRLVNHFNI